MEDRDELLTTVASLYYELDQNQQQIADRLEISRSKVSRLIAEAKQHNIVSIHVRKTTPRDYVLEQELIAHFGLQDAYVLQVSPGVEGGTVLDMVGSLATSYLRRVIARMLVGSSVGVAWGSSVHATVKALPDHFAQHIDVVPLLGGVGALRVDSPDLARMVAAKLGGRHYDLHAPVIVGNSTVRDMLLAEPAVQMVISRARSVELAITGLGSMQEEASSFLRAGLLGRSELADLRSAGIAGEVVGRFFDVEGRSAHVEINERIVGIDIEDLKQIPRTICIACGTEKIQAILGALRGEFFSVLATDDTTARAVLSLAQWAESDAVDRTSVE
jgi:deoxyribonucleoside regulator